MVEKTNFKLIEMVLIISSKYDVSTHIVMSWLNYYRTRVLRVNTEDSSDLKGLTIRNDCTDLMINNNYLSDVKKVWHRRGRLRLLPRQLENLGDISRYLNKEEDALVKGIELYLNNSIEYIGSYIKEVENYKIVHLLKAKEIGFKIPNSIITTSKENLIKFSLENKQIISKDLRYPVYIKNSDHYIESCGTFIVEKSDVEKLDGYFAPIFCQELIEKEFEIRVFFFKTKIYPMAIFSQNDVKTKVDFRNYNTEKPNRCIPFIFPKEIYNQIIKLIDVIGLKTGSIDLIYTKKGDYVFLEVNPMGQFDWVSKNCNYYIEKDIAKNLSNEKRTA